MSRFLICLFLAISLAACCHPQSASTAADDSAHALVMRVHQVTNGSGEELRDRLQSLLGGGPNSTEHGRVTLTGNNQLLVLASPELQSSIAAALKEIKTGPAAKNESSDAVAVRFSVWIVDVADGDVAADPRLESIRAALAVANDELKLGPKFRLHDSFSIVGTSLAHNNFVAKGLPGNKMEGQVMKGLVADGHTLLTNLSIRTDTGGEMDAQIPLEFGQSVVLGQFSAPPAGNAAGPSVSRLIVVRADPVKQG